MLAGIVKPVSCFGNRACFAPPPTAPLNVPSTPAFAAILHRCCRSLLPQNFANSPRFSDKLPEFCNKNPSFHFGFVAKIGFPREWLTIFATKYHFCHDLHQTCCKNTFHGWHSRRLTADRIFKEHLPNRNVRRAQCRNWQPIGSSRIIDYLSICR